MASERAELWARLATGAGDFALDEPAVPPSVWGRHDEVLWASGEGLLIYGSEGVGKSTLAQNLALARAGLREPQVLGLPVTPSDGAVLYLALDRPRQSARSIRRMIEPRQRVRLNRRLKVWRGPLPFDVALDVTGLVELADALGASTLVVDSYKDLTAEGLVGDDTGTAINLAVQHVIHHGIEWLGLHHPKKPTRDLDGRALSAVYGSRWLTAGLGSVVLVDGNPGDKRVQLLHVKQPAAKVGPLVMVHDHPAGSVSLGRASSDLVACLVAAGSGGVRESILAEELFGSGDAERRRLRRALQQLQKQGTAEKVVEGSKGGVGGGGEAALWRAVQP